MLRYGFALTVFLACIIFTLSACTYFESTPNPMARKTVWGGFPFPTGTTWVYSRIQYQQVIGDPTKIITATNLITETVMRADNSVPALTFWQKQVAGLMSAPPDWQDGLDFLNPALWYQIAGNQIFSFSDASMQNRILVYDFPFVVGKSWCPEQPPPANPNCHSMGRRTVQNQTTYTTPAGRFDECYEISEEFNSGGVTEWFCAGVGVVARKYDHAGSRFGFQDRLIRFSIDQPAP